MSYTTQMLGSIPFGNVIGNPLKAAIEAQSIAAQATVEFIQTVGFNKQTKTAVARNPIIDEDNPDIGDVRNVTFSYTTVDPNGKNQKAKLEVPLLTIIPIPFLRIQEMTINFTAKITEEMKRDDLAEYSSESEFTTNYNKKLRDKLYASSEKSFRASVSSKYKNSSTSSSRYQTEYGMDINVKAVQDDMPAGLSRILNILENSIKENRTTLSK